ncbi:MAG: AI-2E family transporter [Flavobacterium sp.]|nr:AI-2E family transporter [Flavobacterium sp.]
MDSKNIALGIIKALGIVTAIGMGLYFITQIHTILVYLMVSLIIALIANPMVELLRTKLKFSNTLAVVVTLLLFILFFLGLLLLFVPLIISQSKNLSLLDIESIKASSLELYQQIDTYLKNKNIDLSNFINQDDIIASLKINQFSFFFTSIIEIISNFGIGLASTLFITFFILKDKAQFIVAIKKILPDDKENRILKSADKIKTLLTRYFIGLIVQLTIICLLYLIVLLIFGVENAIVIAFLCAILNIIPYIGPLIGSVLAGLLTMLSNINNDFQTVTLPTTIYVTIGFFIVQLIDNNVSSPIIFSKSVHSHPLEIFLVVLISGTLFGILGMIIAVPLFTCIKVIAKEFYPQNKIVKVITKNL